jgi:hypothetical protein
MLDQFGYFFSPVQKSWLMNTYRFYPFVSDYFESAAMFAQSRWWSGYEKKRLASKLFAYMRLLPQMVKPTFRFELCEYMLSAQ